MIFGEWYMRTSLMNNPNILNKMRAVRLCIAKVSVFFMFILLPNFARSQSILPSRYNDCEIDVENIKPEKLAGKYENVEIVVYELVGKKNRIRSVKRGYIKYYKTNERSFLVLESYQNEGSSEVKAYFPFGNKRNHFYLAKCIDSK